MKALKKFVLLLISTFCVMGCREDKIAPEYSLDFKLDEGIILADFYARDLKNEHLAHITDKWKKNRVCIYSDTEKFYTKENFTGEFVMVDVFKYLERKTNTIRTVPLLIRNDENFTENRNRWLQEKNGKTFCQNLY